MQGQFSEAHSVIPWDADKDTRYRALTKPTEYLPSAALAAYKASAAPTKAADLVPGAAAPAVPPAATSPASYLTTPMEPQYMGEETGAVWGTEVKYLSAEERKAYELTVGPDGLLRDANQQLFDTDAAYTVSSSGTAIFVMSETGKLYAAMQHKPGYFHHSSFLAGQPVSAAGELVAKQGVITQMSNHSGHYKPEEEFTHQAAEQLWRLGAKDTDKINIISFEH